MFSVGMLRNALVCHYRECAEVSGTKLRGSEREDQHHAQRGVPRSHGSKFIFIFILLIFYLSPIYTLCMCFLVLYNNIYVFFYISLPLSFLLCYLIFFVSAPSNRVT